MKLLSINAGGATVKYGLFEAETMVPFASGQASGIGEPEGQLEHSLEGAERTVRRRPLPDHRAALQAVVDEVMATLGAPCAELAGVGHRVVHGGGQFSAPVRVDDAVVGAIRELGSLAPLHNAVAADGLEIARGLLPELPHIAVFDTAFHAGMPSHARRYALPEAYERRGFRRYGFHGISHRDAAGRAAEWLERPLEELRLITLHLGSGASAAAIHGGVSIDTSMGMTPLEGLVTGTRSGDLDPAAALRLCSETGLPAEDVESMLMRDSGLKALVGTQDMRVIEARAAEGDDRARDAIALFCYRIKKYIGAYWAVLGGLDALIFTGGIGEHSAVVRERSCEGLEPFGIELDAGANHAHRLAAHAGTIPVLVVPADEERAIAQAVRATLERAMNDVPDEA